MQLIITIELATTLKLSLDKYNFGSRLSELMREIITPAILSRHEYVVKSRQTHHDVPIDEPLTDEPLVDEPVINEPVLHDPPVENEQPVDKPLVDEPINIDCGVG